MIEQCRCGGAICSHGRCTRCNFCKHCGTHGREVYEDQLAEALDAERGYAPVDSYDYWRDVEEEDQ